MMIMSACCGKIYDFRGANIPPDVNSFSVDFFKNEATIVNPELSILITEKLKTKFQTESRLKLVASSGDYKFAGTIKDYKISQASLDNTGASQNQLTINVKVIFISEFHPEKNFERDYSFFKTYLATEDFNIIENNLATEITDVIVQKIFAEVALDW